VLEASGAGWLRLTSDNSDLYAASRTFNDNPAGTYGQNVTAVGVAEVFGANDTAVLAGVSSSDGFRTNVGITSLSAENTTYRLTAYAEVGTLIGELMVSVGANGMTQTIRVLGDLLDYTGRAWLTVSTDDPDAAFTTYASVVDGATGDSAYIPGVGIGTE